MKANSADEKTTGDMKKWLEKPRNGAEAGLGIDVQQDLQFIQNSKDLSSISLNNEKSESAVPKAPSVNNNGITDGAGTSNGGGGGGGFLALFGCASKRK